MSIWRIDLMSEIEIPDFNYETGEGGYNILPKREVQNKLKMHNNFKKGMVKHYGKQNDYQRGLHKNRGF